MFDEIADVIRKREREKVLEELDRSMLIGPLVWKYLDGTSKDGFTIHFGNPKIDVGWFETRSEACNVAESLAKAIRIFEGK